MYCIHTNKPKSYARPGSVDFPRNIDDPQVSALSHSGYGNLFDVAKGYLRRGRFSKEILRILADFEQSRNSNHHRVLYRARLFQAHIGLFSVPRRLYG